MKYNNDSRLLPSQIQEPSQLTLYQAVGVVTELAVNHIDYYRALGMMMWLMKHADYHSQWPLWSVENDIMPTLLQGQTKLYFDDNQNPVGFVTWAWPDDVAREQVLQDEDQLKLEQRNSGEHLLFVDFVAPWGHTQNILVDLTTKVFPNYQAFGLRRNPDSSVRKICFWKGTHYQGRMSEEQRILNRWLPKRNE